MITAVDTNVLLDVFLDDPQFADWAEKALLVSAAAGSVVACEVVWAELSGFFGDQSRMEEAMQRLDVNFEGMGVAASFTAGAVWRQYRAEGGRRVRVLPDFLIGAHALKQADRLVSRDRGFYRKYFPDLPLLNPAIDLPGRPGR